jgi:ABC-type glycerol-3-phosphate transport system permease component
VATTQSSREGKGAPRLGAILSHAVLIAISVVALYPIYYMVITAFKGREEYLSSQILPP